MPFHRSKYLHLQVGSYNSDGTMFSKWATTTLQFYSICMKTLVVISCFRAIEMDELFQF